VRGEPVELSCPYCDKGRIQCWYIPNITSEKRYKTATFGVKKDKIKSPDIWLIKSGYDLCGK
jgi:hypothetical protein